LLARVDDLLSNLLFEMVGSNFAHVCPAQKAVLLITVPGLV
jgi:hypothetical protein